MRAQKGRWFSQLNIERELLHDLANIVNRQNDIMATQAGRPRIEIAESQERLAEAATLMARAFVRNYDKFWLAWLSSKDVHRISAGNFDGAERKIARTIHYFLTTAVLNGGIVAIETAEDDESGRRLVRGAALRSLPPVLPRGEGMLLKYVIGGSLALRNYGLFRALAAEKSYQALYEATESACVGEGIPKRRIDNGIICVCPSHWHKRVASRLYAPFHELADRHGLYCVLQSSSPETNDARVFNRFGYEKIGEHHYGASVFNTVGPYTINFLARAPRSAPRLVRNERRFDMAEA